MNNRKSFQATLLAGGLLASSLVFLPLASAAGKKPLAGYDTLVVESFVVAPTQATLGFSPRQAAEIRQDAIDRLLGERLFAEVIDAADPPALGARPEARPAEGARRLVLSGTVTKFSKGSRAKRYLVGFGAGASAVKVLFVFRDEASGEVVYRTERQGKYYGTVSIFGGESREAATEAAGDVVDGLIKDVKKNR